MFNSEHYFNRILIPYVENRLPYKLLSTQKLFIRNILNEAPAGFFKGKSIQQITKELTDIIEQKLTYSRYSDRNISTKELFKKEMDVFYDKNEVEYIFAISKPSLLKEEAKIVEKPKEIVINKFFGMDWKDIRELRKPKQIKTKKAYIILDTKYRILDEQGLTRYSWNLINTINNSQGVINSIEEIRNIKSVKVYPFRIPNQTSVTYNGFKIISLQLEEYATQCYLAQEGCKFHFIMNSVADGVYLDLSPFKYADNTFEFSKNITVANTFSISLYNPIQRITFLQDRYTSTIIPQNPTIIVTQGTHNLSNGDYVVFENFITNDPDSDSSIIAQMTDPHGLVVSNVLSDRFTVPINTSSITYYQNSQYVISGRSAFTNNSTQVVGTGTYYTTELYPLNLSSRDRKILVDDGNGNYYEGVISTVNSDTQFTLSTAWTRPSISSASIRRRVAFGTTRAAMTFNGTTTVTGDTFIATLANGDVIAYNNSLGNVITFTIVSVNSDSSLTASISLVAQSIDAYYKINDSTIAPYKAAISTSGLLTLTNGSTAITGSGTQFTTELAFVTASDQNILIQNPSASSSRITISTVNSNSSATLSSPWAGTTLSTYRYWKRVGFGTGVAYTLTFNGTTTVTGSGFLTNLKVGDWLQFTISGPFVIANIVVSNIISDTTLTANISFGPGTANEYFKVIENDTATYYISGETTTQLTFTTFVQKRRIQIPMEITMDVEERD
jgi:hypothetical protein